MRKSVLDGNINPFINSYLNWISTGSTEVEKGGYDGGVY